jgi:hypothetical protein
MNDHSFFIQYNTLSDPTSMKLSKYLQIKLRRDPMMDSRLRFYLLRTGPDYNGNQQKRKQTSPN